MLVVLQYVFATYCPCYLAIPVSLLLATAWFDDNNIVTIVDKRASLMAVIGQSLLSTKVTEPKIYSSSLGRVLGNIIVHALISNLFTFRPAYIPWKLFNFLTRLFFTNLVIKISFCCIFEKLKNKVFIKKKTLLFESKIKY